MIGQVTSGIVWWWLRLGQCSLPPVLLSEAGTDFITIAMKTKARRKGETVWEGIRGLWPHKPPKIMEEWADVVRPRIYNFEFWGHVYITYLCLSASTYTIPKIFSINCLGCCTRVSSIPDIGKGHGYQTNSSLFYLLGKKTGRFLWLWSLAFITFILMGVLQEVSKVQILCSLCVRKWQHLTLKNEGPL